MFTEFLDRAVMVKDSRPRTILKKPEFGQK